MRWVSWFGGLLVVLVVVAAVGIVSHERGHVSSTQSLMAAHHATAPPGLTVDPHRLVARDLVLPTPAPTAPPAAAAAAPARPAAPPAIVVGSTQQAMINADRARNGLGPLTWNGCLYNVAVANARRIAAQGYLSHTNGPSADLACGLGHQGGENIGWYSGGINDSWMNSKFMASPEHYANIMGPYHYVATAWVVAPNGYGYIAVEFS